MYYKVTYSGKALKSLRKLERRLAQSIIKKIEFFANQKNIFKFAEPLKGLGKEKYRFRIGTYRVIFTINKSGKIKILMILDVKHRREAYMYFIV